MKSNIQTKEMAVYCEHFQYLKTANAFYIEQNAACKYCYYPKSNLYMCLTANCNSYVCGRNKYEHLLSHLNQSRRRKKFHSIFINILTAQIRCIECNIQIYDIDLPQNLSHKHKKDPFSLRLFVQPALEQLTKLQMTGCYQNSEGHRRSNKNLTGLFGNKYNHTINSAIQFLSHCPYIKELISQIQTDNKVLQLLSAAFKQMEEAHYRAISSEAIAELFFKLRPSLKGYSRKDPFDHILSILLLINQEVSFTLPTAQQKAAGYDEWDLHQNQAYKVKAKVSSRNNPLIDPLIKHSALTAALQVILNVDYQCPQCSHQVQTTQAVQFIKLPLVSKKRKIKDVEKDLSEVRAESPSKKRGNSLINFILGPSECPITIPQLLIDFLKSKIHREECKDCGVGLTKKKMTFNKLPKVLLLQVGRMSKEGQQTDQTMVQLMTVPLDMGPFTAAPQQSLIYDFQAAICIERGVLFPVVVRSQMNNQLYKMLNEQLKLAKEDLNAYIVCYQLRQSQVSVQKYRDLLSRTNNNNSHILPDFWMTQFKYGIQLPLYHPMVCKHNRLKPIKSKMKSKYYLSKIAYSRLAHQYQGDVFENEDCEECKQDIQRLELRKMKQRQLVAQFDRQTTYTRKQNTQNRQLTLVLPYCMIAKEWISKWFNFIYSNKEAVRHLHKGHPIPPPIDNSFLLDGKKCKANLVKNEHYKVVNLRMWRFLKELYGGGPEIRYKVGDNHFLYEEIIAQCKSAAADVKALYDNLDWLDSPRRTSISQSFIQKSSIFIPANESSEREQKVYMERQQILLEEQQTKQINKTKIKKQENQQKLPVVIRQKALLKIKRQQTQNKQKQLKIEEKNKNTDFQQLQSQEQYYQKISSTEMKQRNKQTRSKQYKNMQMKTEKQRNVVEGDLCQFNEEQIQCSTIANDNEYKQQQKSQNYTFDQNIS